MKHSVVIAALISAIVVLFGCPASVEEEPKGLDDFYYSESDLGLIWQADRSVFKVWSPAAGSVSVALYEDPGTYNSSGKVTDNRTDALYPMAKDSGTGVWSVSIPENLAGKYYLYRVTLSNGSQRYAPDPYAKAVSANGQRMAIIDLADTNPPGWKPAEKPAFSTNWQDAIIYELHMRDFSIDSNSGMTHRGKFLAFTETGTQNSAGDPTGIDHLKNLGITHVHLLPVFDFASIDELNANNQFNWGYDPQHYNVPEGSYATDARDPKARIIEFKRMVQALHDAGIRVIMDVVYNHTASVQEGPFERLVPGYFYRTTASGALSNGSGCGNEVATERPMVRKYIIDSCTYWAREYNIDGFRFDLMGLIDTPTMEQLVQEVRAEVDQSILIYGEPWQAGGSVLAANLQTNKGAQKDKQFAVFNDNIRGAIKGGSDDGSKGFATGQSGREWDIVNGVKGAIYEFTARAGESVNYVTAHDNLNLWDKISMSFGASRDTLYHDPYNKINSSEPLFASYAVKSVLLANGIVLTSQGIPFFQAGDEMLRSKLGDHNSYASPDSTNRIRWENAGKYREVVQYYAGLIRLRKAHPAFRMDSKADIDAKLDIPLENPPRDNVVSFRLKDNANGDAWRTIFVAYNGADNAAPKTLSLPSGVWYQVVDAERAGVDTIRELTGTVTVQPLSLVVLHD
ncbi:MAG: type I pullulanase [Treponema sp.]|nr:type I pullulanase [Treponema sp.]